MTEREDIDMLAAEYVLGTLDAAERTAVAARRRREPALESAIVAWERRLDPLNQEVAAVPPAGDMLARIEQRLAGPLPAAGAGADIVALQRRVTTWRRLAIGASAIAASLMLAIGVREATRPQLDTNWVAVFQKDDESPSFLLSVDLEKRQLTVRMVAAQPQTGKTYQLWIASPTIGPQPRSLGLIQDAAYTTHQAGYDRGLLQQATFGISLEPAGGSPTGVPTGPALHAKLIRQTP